MKQSTTTDRAHDNVFWCQQYPEFDHTGVDSSYELDKPPTPFKTTKMPGFAPIAAAKHTKSSAAAALTSLRQAGQLHPICGDIEAVDYILGVDYKKKDGSDRRPAVMKREKVSCDFAQFEASLKFQYQSATATFHLCSSDSKVRNPDAANFALGEREAIREVQRCLVVCRDKVFLVDILWARVRGLYCREIVLAAGPWTAEVSGEINLLTE